ncbi:SDR family NAD(P)-dependent oxidoreductase [Segnochrobactraceae bacterium EtOH-i3]
MSDAKSGWLGLSGRVCVVTGAGGGIGRAIVLGFAAEGAKVLALDLSADHVAETASLARAAGGIVVPMVADASREADIEAAATQCDESFGGCDILVNNAGLLRPGGLDTLTAAEWNRLIEVNLTGYFLHAQIFGRRMLSAGRGVLIHVASIAGGVPQDFSGAYSVGKAGVRMLSQQLATEWGPRGVRSNVVNPGLIRTPLSAAFYATPGLTEAREALIPARRIGRPEDIADAVLFLASDRASYITGDEITVDGGFTRTIMNLIPRPGFDAPKG